MIQQLESVNAPAYAQIRILALDPDDPSRSGIQLAGGGLTMPNGEVLQVPEGQRIPWNALPAQELLFITEDTGD
jgi:hypothetical protein